MARESDPNTIGLAGATASQNRRVRTAVGGHRMSPLAPAGSRAGDAPSGARQIVIAATTPITRCGR